MIKAASWLHRSARNARLRAMTDYSFQTLHSDGGARVIFRGVVGSRAYGTDRPESDEDIRGVFLVPPLEYALLAAPPEQVADERNDRVYYSLRRFAGLAAASNPNALELFWLPPDCIRLDTPRFARLRENRKLFLSRRAVDTHIGYALAQIKKARGCNKRVWNPQPEEPPRPEAFCRVVLGAEGGEPRSPSEAGIDLATCRITRIDGVEGAFAETPPRVARSAAASRSANPDCGRTPLLASGCCSSTRPPSRRPSAPTANTGSGGGCATTRAGSRRNRGSSTTMQKT